MRNDLSLVKYAIEQGAVVSVWDTIYKDYEGTDQKAIREAIEQYDDCELVFRDAKGEQIGWAYIVSFGNSADELVSDFQLPKSWKQEWWDSQFTN
jgi:hypothetical protein